jgi:hypothetical protein
VQENLKLLKNREFELVDWENLLEEIEDMGRRYLDSVVSLMAVILEHLYKWEHFRYREYAGHGWIKSINNARKELRTTFKRHPSVKAKSQEKENIQTAWELAVYSLIDWFKEPKNQDLAKKILWKVANRKGFPTRMPLYLPAGYGIQTLG